MVRRKQTSWLRVIGLNNGVFVAFHFLVGSTHAFADDLPPLSMDKAVETALRKHPILDASRHWADAARERMNAARGTGRPTVAIQGAATNGPAGAPAFGAPGLQGLVADPLKSHYGGSLNVVLPLFDFGRTSNSVASRKSLFDAAKDDIEVRRSQVVLSVKQAYLDVLRAQQLVLVQKESVRRRETAEKTASEFVRAGLKAQVDLLLVQSELADVQSALISAENDVRVAFATLNRAMGEVASTQYQLQADASSKASGSADQTVESLFPIALRNRPELQGTDHRIRSTESAFKAAKSDLLPRVDSIASAGYINPSKLISENKPFGIGLMVTVPLYSGGVTEAHMGEEKARREALLAEKRDAEEAVKLQVTEAWLGVKTKRSLLASALEQETAAQASRTLSAERYALQVANLDELITAESLAQRASAQAVNRRYDLLQSQILLDWTLGTLTPRTEFRRSKP